MYYSLIFHRIDSFSEPKNRLSLDNQKTKMAMNKQLFTLLILIFSASVGFSQTQPIHEKKYFQTESGKIFWHAELPFVLSISPNADGSGGLVLKNTESTKSNYDSLYFTNHGKHYIKRSTPSSKWREEAFGIFVDGKAPSSSITFDNAPKYISGGVTYYGKGLTSTISAKDQDEMSGVEQIFQSIDGVPYADYTNTLTLNSEKAYNLKYYALDKVGNAEKPNNKLFTVDLTAPETKYTLSGDRIEAETTLSPRSFIELGTTDNLAGVKRTYYNFDATPDKTYSSKVGMAGLPDGEHIFNFFATDNVENEATKQNYSFYLDRNEPEIIATIEGDLYEKSGVNYISERSKVQMTATDNKSGVKGIFYLIDGAGTAEFSEPFLVEKNQGKHKITYYGIDNVENKGGAKTDDVLGNLYLDLTSPTIGISFSGDKFTTRDTLFVSGRTEVNLSSTDAQSGVQFVKYTLDSGSEVAYDSKFTVNQLGTHKIAYNSKDNVNNASEKDYVFVVDNQGPEIIPIFSTKSLGKETANGKSLDIYPTYNTVYLASSDDVVGAKTIYYSLDGASERTYTTPISTAKKGAHTLKIRAIDQVKNETVDTLEFFIQ